MGSYGFSVLRYDNEDKKFLKVETFCFDRDTAVEECQRLRVEQPMYDFTYTETDITEVLTEEQIKKGKEDFYHYMRIAESFDNKEE